MTVDEAIEIFSQSDFLKKEGIVSMLEELKHYRFLFSPVSNPDVSGERPYSVCESCSNNPKNGGSGICFCTLGTPGITIN